MFDIAVRVLVVALAEALRYLWSVSSRSNATHDFWGRIEAS